MKVDELLISAKTALAEADFPLPITAQWVTWRFRNN
jgi:hypothetical protein